MGKLANFGSAIVKTGAKVANFAHEHSSDIHMVVGASMIIGGTVCVGLATKKYIVDIKGKEQERFEKKLEATGKGVESVNEETGEIEIVYDIPEDELKKLEKKNKNETRWMTVKAYALPVGLVGGGMIVSGKGYLIVKDRLFQTSVAFNALQAWTANYQRRVEDYVGKEKNEELMRGTQKKTPETVDESGNTTYSVEVDDQAMEGPFIFELSEDTSRFFEEHSKTYNDSMISEAQAKLQRKLDSGRIIFLNEALDELGMDLTPEGQVIGWKPIYMGGRGQIDFGAKDIQESDSSRRAIYVPRVSLRFNCDGLVIDGLDSNALME